jgi:hypothetical protein
MRMDDLDEEWASVWSGMRDEELEDRLFTYVWLALDSPNAHANRVAQLFREAERCGHQEMVERARVESGKRHQSRKTDPGTERITSVDARN